MIVLSLLLATIAQDRANVFPGGDEPAVATRSCDPAGDDITVCGNPDPSRFRMLELEARYAPKPLRARAQLPGVGTTRVDAVQRGVGGVSVPSAMVTLKVPLGAKKKKKK